MYEQTLGLTSAVAMLGGIIAAVLDWNALRTRVPILLVAVLSLVILSTALNGGVDDFAVLSLLSTFVPLIGLAVIFGSPSVRSSVLWACVALFVGAVTVVVAGTAAWNLARGTLGERFDLYLMGPSTESGLVLASLLPLSLGVPVRSELRALSTGVLGGGILLTQTRGALLAAAIGVLVIALFMPRWRIWAVVAVCVGVSAFTLISDRSLLTLNDTSNVGRQEELSRHARLLLERPSLGFGLSREGVGAVRAAHNTLLGLGNAAGVYAALIFVAAWVTPVVAALKRRLADLTTATAAGAMTAVLIGWNTTGTELLIFVPPTNLVPLVLATALVDARLREAK
jgi:hypothetical protein